MTHRPSDVLSDGVMMFDSNQNQFLVYREGVGWESMSWMPDPEDISKWDRFGSAIRSDVSVGIGRIPNTVSLSVSKNVLVSQNVTLSGELNVFGSAMINGGYGFNWMGIWWCHPLNLTRQCMVVIGGFVVFWYIIWSGRDCIDRVISL